TAYENRLRIYSQPSKVFRYFATIKMRNKAGRWEVFMTPSDFLRSILPGIPQPENLGLDKYRVLDEKGAEKWESKMKRDSIFLKLETKGLLTFSDYVLLTILLSIPQRHIEIGFKLFDLNDDGTLSIHDLESLLLAITQGEASAMNTHLKNTLFGPKLNKHLSLAQFLEFFQELTEEILNLEYEMLLKDRSVISELDFSKLVLSHKSSPTERHLALKRVKKKYGQQMQGITKAEFIDFFRLVKELDSVDMALSYHYLAGADISRQTLRHIAEIVAGVTLTEHMMDVIFTIFDADRNGVLGRREFIKALRTQRTRTHSVRNHFRFTSALNVVCKCAWRTLPVRNSKK
ncbi:hypothetical protein KR074_003930, partial [Drosophila pseudoananassae]